MGQREMRGAVGDRKGGGGDVIHLVGDRHHRSAIDDDLLGIAAAEAQHRENPPAAGQMRHRRAGLDHLAGGFEAGGERELGFDLVLAGDHQRVGEIDAAGSDADARLMRQQSGAGGLVEPQRFGSAPFPAQDCFHARLPGSPFPGGRGGWTGRRATR
jgi:hypothetical protein